MRIRWTMPAADDLESIYHYLKQNLPHFAEPTVRSIYQSIRALRSSPHLGRPGHLSDTHELPLAPLPYIVVYTLKADAVEILRIYHGAQDWRQ